MEVIRPLLAHIIVISILFTTCSFVSVLEEVSAYTPHAPIYIYGNENFTAANGVTGGNGTVSNPYVIEGWEISASGLDGIGIWFSDAHFIIRDVHVHSGGSSYSGINLRSVANGSINNVNVSNNEYGMEAALGKNISITNTTAMSNARWGIGLTNSNDCFLYGNSATFNDMGILLTGDDNFVANNNASWNREGLEVSGSDNTAINNVAVSNSETGIYLDGKESVISRSNASWNGEGFRLSGSNMTIRNNVAYSNIEDGISLYFASDSMASNNTALFNGGGGIGLTYSHRNIIVDNVVTDNSWGIGLSISYDNLVLRNLVVGNPVGISLGDSHRNTVAHNYIEGVITGVRLLQADRNLIANNTVSGHEYGITIGDSHNSTVIYNIVSDNKWGVQITRWYSQHNTIAFNDILSNLYEAVFLHHCRNNTVHHNNIIDNGMQAYDNYVNNTWDDGYPSGGNYWSVYSGVDLNSGPNQDQPGSDDIGDTPFIIDPDSRDNYPLMSPFGSILIRRPSLLQAYLNGSSFEDVILLWDLSPDDGKGFQSVNAYEIYRNSTYNPLGSGYGLIGTLPNGTSEFVDSLAGEGDPNNYFYRVCAVDLSGNSSCAGAQAGKYTRILLEGQNLVSIPLVQSNGSTEKVLQTVKFNKAWTYDPSIEKWKSYMTFKPHKGELSTIDHKMGIWVNVTEASNLTVAGIVPYSTEIQLRAGWNLIGFPSFNTLYAVGDLKSETGAIRLEGFDSLAPPYFLKLLGDGDLLRAGDGYWVLVRTFAVWTVTNS